VRKKRVILYDDDMLVLNLMKDYFTQRGYEVIKFHKPVICQADEYGRNCTKTLPCADIVLTDYMMPTMNGIELLIAQSRIGCKIPYQNKALISGYIDEIVLKKLRSLGLMYFEKPICFDDLGAWLDKREMYNDLLQQLGTARNDRHNKHNESSESQKPRNRNNIPDSTSDKNASGLDVTSAITSGGELT